MLKFPFRRRRNEAAEIDLFAAVKEIKETTQFFETPVDEPIIVVHPGTVAGVDGDRHLVTFVGLCDFYGVDPRRVLNAAHPAHASLAKYRRALRPEEIIDLYPREDGDYTAGRLGLGLIP